MGFRAEAPSPTGTGTGTGTSTGTGIGTGIGIGTGTGIGIATGIGIGIGTDAAWVHAQGRRRSARAARVSPGGVLTPSLPLLVLLPSAGGNAYNQLAVLATLDGNLLAAAFYYLR